MDRWMDAWMDGWMGGEGLFVIIIVVMGLRWLYGEFLSARNCWRERELTVVKLVGGLSAVASIACEVAMGYRKRSRFSFAGSCRRLLLVKVDVVWVVVHKRLVPLDPFLVLLAITMEGRP